MNKIYLKILQVKVRIWDYLCKIRMRTTMSDEHLSHVAMFHNIKTSEEKLVNPYECYDTELVEYIKYCKKLNMKFRSVDELLALPRELIKKNNCIITFDDGFASTYEIAAPILFELDIPFIVFITTSYIGHKGYMNKQQIYDLSKNPLCTIGLHSHEHVMWRFEKEQKLYKDFHECKKIISSIINSEPKYFAFPYGSMYAVSARNIKTVKRLGVKSIFLTSGLKINIKNLLYPYKIPRLDIPGYFNNRR